MAGALPGTGAAAAQPQLTPAQLQALQQQQAALAQQQAAQRAQAGNPAAGGATNPTQVSNTAQASLPPPETPREPLKLKFKGRTYIIITKVAEEQVKPTFGAINPAQTLMGIMLRHGIAALEREHGIEVTSLDKLKIIESVPQNVEEQEDGKTITKQVTSLKLEYTYSKGGQTKTFTTEIKDELKLKEKDNDNIDKTCSGHDIDYNDRRAINTAQKAYHKAMQILRTNNRDLMTCAQAFAPAPFEIELAKLSKSAKKAYKPSETEKKPDIKTDGADKKATPDKKASTTQKTDEESKLNSFALREAEKTTYIKTTTSTESSPDPRREDADSPTWEAYFLRGELKASSNKPGIVDSDITFDKQEAFETLKAILLSNDRWYAKAGITPLRFLNKRQKVLLKRLILIFYKNFDAFKKFSNSSQKIRINPFHECIGQIMVQLDKKKYAEEVDKQYKLKLKWLIEDLKQRMIRICQNNKDLKAFVERLKKERKKSALKK